MKQLKTQNSKLKTSLVYIAYPNSPNLRSANAVQTHATLHALKQLAPDTLVIIPRMARGPGAFDSIGVRYLPRIGIGRLSRIYRSTLLYYAERSAFAWMVLAYLSWLRLRGQHYDVVYVREVITAFWLALLLPRLTGARVLYEVHDLEARNHSRARERWAQPLLQIIDRVTLQVPAGLVSLTEAFRQQLERDGLRPAQDVAVLPDAYDEQRYYAFSSQERAAARQALGIAPDAILVVYAGLTFAYRGLDMLLDALAEASTTIFGLRAALVGGRPQELVVLREQAQRLGILECVTFTGQQDQNLVAHYLAAGDILCVPDTVTDVTASPLKLFEYMATGQAIICPDIPALHEITGGDGALHVPRRNTSALAQAIIRLAGDPQLRQELGQRALQRVEPYTYTQRAKKLLAIAEKHNL